MSKSDSVFAVFWSRQGGIKSPSKKVIARREKQRLRDLKKRKRDDLEKFLEQQNAMVDADMVKSLATIFSSNDSDDLSGTGCGTCLSDWHSRRVYSRLLASQN